MSSNGRQTALHDRVIIITGSSSGIGASCAVSCSRQGARVVVCGRNEQRMREVADLCGAGANPDKVHCVRGDLADQQSVQNIVDSTVQKFGRIDCLVLCAGYSIPRGTEQSTIADVRELWTLHILAPFLMIQAALPYLKQSHKHHTDTDSSCSDNKENVNYNKIAGNIIFISSLMGYYPFSINLPYSITKAAQDQFARLLSRELHVEPDSGKDPTTSPGKDNRETGSVRVNSVRPGWIRTPIIEHSGVIGGSYTAAFVFKVLDLQTPVGRCGNPDEIGDYVALLASDACQAVNGQNLMVDGGQSLPYCSVSRCGVM